MRTCIVSPSSPTRLNECLTFDFAGNVRCNNLCVEFCLKVVFQTAQFYNIKRATAQQLLDVETNICWRWVSDMSRRAVRVLAERTGPRYVVSGFGFCWPWLKFSRLHKSSMCLAERTGPRYVLSGFGFCW